MQAQGIIHQTTTPAGITTATTNLDRCIQVKSFAGQVLASRCERIHRTDVFNQGEPQVILDTSRGVFTLQDRTCEFRTTMQIVMGEVRHVELEEQCTTI